MHHQIRPEPLNSEWLKGPPLQISERSRVHDQHRCSVDECDRLLLHEPDSPIRPGSHGDQSARVTEQCREPRRSLISRVAYLDLVPKKRVHGAIVDTRPRHFDNPMTGCTEPQAAGNKLRLH